MPNNRIYYASQTVQLKPQNADTLVYSNWYQPLGLQSVSMNTTFDLQQAFQLGTVELYDNVEGVPNVEVSISRILDNTAPLYTMCMGGQAGVDGAFNQPLGALSTNRVNFRLGIYEDTKQFTSGNAASHVVCSGMYLSRFSYTFPVEGNATEEVTLVGNHKIWNTGTFFTADNAYIFSTSNIFHPDTKLNSPTEIFPTKTSGIITRQYVNIIGSILPTGYGGIKLPNSANSGQDQTGAVIFPHFQNITISSDLGRENINELGKFSPYCRYTTFPIEVTSEFQVSTTEGDYVDAKDFYLKDFCGEAKSNLVRHPIAIRVNSSNSNLGSCSNGMILNLGNQNTLTSINHAGGDTGGGNVTVTYSFRNFNNFFISASGTYANGVYVGNNTTTVSAN